MKMFVDTFTAEARKKINILCSITVCFIIISIILAYNSVAEWKSKTTLMTPTYTQVSSLSTILSSISNIDNTRTESISQDYIFQQFINEIDNLDNKKNYLKSIGIYTNKLGIEKTIRVSLTPDKKIIEVAFLADTAEKAKKDLEGFLVYTNRLVNKKLIKHVDSVIKSVAIDLKIKEDVIKKAAAYKLDNRKMELQISAEITKKAGQNDPFSDPGVSMELPVSLGYNLLNSQLKEYEINAYNVFLDDTDIKSKLDVLRNIKTTNINIEAFDFKEMPDLPENKSSPSLIKYMLIAVLCSIILSVVIIMNGVRKSVIARCN
ncbi:hypothetical protein GL264_10490 [Aeromonas jandaei]|uniref:hypothetical protein n=1 Tax=Aeromonas jandaei TaxID=650 RepID=UPI001C5B002A|nr:hypothetical protein [Aeromonas jandaei]MBW3761228.1 hypothetical protein [Aeromonas jandaei]